MMYIQVLVGFVALIGGAEILVRGAVSLAGRMGISPMVIGMTVVAVGTSAPELVVSVNAALEGATGLAVGNVIGSNIANVLLVFGAACLLSPIVERPASMTRDAAGFSFGTLIFVALCLRGALDWQAGVILLAAFIAFIGISYWRGSSDPDLSADTVEEVEDLQGWPATNAGVALAVIGGLAGLAAGSEFLVQGGVEIARSFGVSEEVIGLTLLALGTSLPELAALVVASMKGHADVGFGNIVGSNLFNILGVAGTAALIAPLPIHEQILSFDLWVMLVSSALLMPVLLFGWRTGRMAGLLFAAAYVSYIWIQTVGVTQVVG